MTKNQKNKKGNPSWLPFLFLIGDSFILLITLKIN